MTAPVGPAGRIHAAIRRVGPRSRVGGGIGRPVGSDGSGDEMLLKRGDTWHESLGTWTKSGRSASEPIVIGAFGAGARPTVSSGSGRALVTGTNTYRTVNHLAIMGIRFYADARDPDSP